MKASSSSLAKPMELNRPTWTRTMAVSPIPSSNSSTRRSGAKTWVIVIGEEFELDKPIVELDLPQGHDHSDPFGYQIRRRKAPAGLSHEAKTKNHLRHTANNDTDLQNIILRLRDDLGELRRGANVENADSPRRSSPSFWVLRFWVPAAGGAISSCRLECNKSAPSKYRRFAHLLQTTEETHRRAGRGRNLADWKNGRSCAKQPTAHRLRRSRIRG